jgi:aryl-alcohol dehydrogenase-like predicted oxidoreductase
MLRRGIACRLPDLRFIFSPLARNLLATKLETPPNDGRAFQPRYSKENLAVNQKILDKIEVLGAKYDCTAAQLSLAWLFHKANELGVSVIPIPGTTKLHNASTNFGAVTIIISDADAQVLEGLADQVAGARAGDGYLATTIEHQK